MYSGRRARAINTKLREETCAFETAWRAAASRGRHAAFAQPVRAPRATACSSEPRAGGGRSVEPEVALQGAPLGRPGDGRCREPGGRDSMNRRGTGEAANLATGVSADAPQSLLLAGEESQTRAAGRAAQWSVGSWTGAPHWPPTPETAGPCDASSFGSPALLAHHHSSLAAPLHDGALDDSQRARTSQGLRATPTSCVTRNGTSPTNERRRCLQISHAASNPPSPFAVRPAGLRNQTTRPTWPSSREPQLE